MGESAVRKGGRADRKGRAKEQCERVDRAEGKGRAKGLKSRPKGPKVAGVNVRIEKTEEEVGGWVGEVA